MALKRLGIEAGNALPLGQGVWAEIIRNRMAKEGLISLIDNAEGDNGWCLALVEPDGERTFMSFSGVENQWNRQWLARLTVAPGSLLYFSGYQLASPCGELLVEWLEELQDVTPFIDFGPRIGDIPDALLARIMACRYWCHSIVRRLKLPPNVLLYPQISRRSASNGRRNLSHR